MSPIARIDPFDAFEAIGWEKAAESYERFFGPITGRLIDPILDATNVGPGTRLLDVACGQGNLSSRAAARGAYPVGVDVASAMVDRARATYPDLDFRRGDAHALPFPAAAFDVAVANFAILHLSQPERGVAELSRVLVSGGRVALTVWDLPERARLFAWVQEAMVLAGVEAPDNIPAGPPFFRFAVDDEMRKLLNHNGFKDASVKSITFTHFTPSIDHVWNGIIGGTVRTAALVRNQSQAARSMIHEAFNDVVARDSPRGQVHIPFSVKLATATKAESQAGSPSSGLTPPA